MEYDELIDYIEAFSITKKKLDLSNKDISEIPPEIEKLTQIEYLDLSYNRLEHLPENLFKLVNLKTLLLTRNELVELPPAICLLQLLETLDISNNKLETFPAEIGKLENLISLDASFNKLAELPMELTNLLSLRKLYLEENPLIFPPEKVIKRGLYATMIFLAHMKKKRDATKVFIQIFNMPDEAKALFEQYVDNFQNLVVSELEYGIKFDINYIDKRIITTKRKT
ncbi:MAG: leucine-rich repeat domain-containing protein [Bacteroidia bacterium]|nr:leucine-rich repeat domain-containing protein [Bacteroidia bacterium]